MQLNLSWWTDDRVEQLKSFNARGWSGAQIAAEMGTTRGAIIGKRHRLGLPDCSHLRPSPAPKSRCSSNPKMLNKVLVWKTAFAKPVPAERKNDKPISLFELTPDSCRWPTGHPGEPGFGFCGGMAISELPYCAGHVQIAYLPPNQR